MRTATAIFLLTLLTITQTSLGQLLKLPLLIEHFYKHQEKDAVSLLSFLEDHYLKEHNDTDSTEDEQLPFKTVSLQTIAAYIVPGIVKTSVAVSLEIPVKVIFCDIYTPQQHLCSIFHPPRA